MERKKIIIFLAAFVMAAVAPEAPAGAQNLWEVGVELWNKLLQPNPRLDTAWIFQPAKKLGFSTTYELVNTKVVTTVSEDFQAEDTRILLGIKLWLNDRAAHNVGIKARYGPISVGFSHEVGRKVGKNKVYALNYLASNYGLEARYSHFSAPLAGTLSMQILENPSQDIAGYSEETPIESDYPGQMQTTVLNGFYAFNRKRFSYVSAYNGSIVQKKSAGSVMAAAKYMHGDLRINADEFVLLTFMVGIGRSSTDQISLGGGYSYNWVPLHRNAAGNNGLTGLRNLTFNVTALPMLTVFDRSVTREYVASEYTEYTDKETRKYVSSGKPIPNFMTRAGMSFATGHFYASLWSDFNYFAYLGKTRLLDEGFSGTMKVSQKGHFSTWRLFLQLNYRF